MESQFETWNKSDEWGTWDNWSSSDDGDDDDNVSNDEDNLSRISDTISYKSVIENTSLSLDDREELLRLCQKVSETFKLSKEQIKKIHRYKANVRSVGGLRQRMKGNSYIKQPFSDDEIATIEANYKSFCEKYRFDPQRDINIFLPNPFRKHPLNLYQLHTFILHLSTNLPNRQMGRVYKKFLNMKYFYRKGRFSPEEDELLKSWYDLSKGSGRCCLAIVGRILRRNQDRVRFRLMRLMGTAKFKELNSKKKILEAKSQLFETDIQNCKNDEYPSWTNNEEEWEKIAKINGQHDIKTIKRAYFKEIYPAARSFPNAPRKKPKPRQFKLFLLKQLASMDNPTWESVDWAQLGEKCYNVGAVRVYSAIRKLVKIYVPAKYWSDLTASIRRIEDENHELLKRFCRENYRLVKDEHGWIQLHPSYMERGKQLVEKCRNDKKDLEARSSAIRRKLLKLRLRGCEQQNSSVRVSSRLSAKQTNIISGNESESHSTGLSTVEADVSSQLYHQETLQKHRVSTSLGSSRKYKRIKVVVDGSEDEEGCGYDPSVEDSLLNGQLKSKKSKESAENPVPFDNSSTDLSFFRTSPRKKSKLSKPGSSKEEYGNNDQVIMKDHQNLSITSLSCVVSNSSSLYVQETPLKRNAKFPLSRKKYKRIKLDVADNDVEEGGGNETHVGESLQSRLSKSEEYKEEAGNDSVQDRFDSSTTGDSIFQGPPQKKTELSKPDNSKEEFGNEDQVLIKDNRPSSTTSSSIVDPASSKLSVQTPRQAQHPLESAVGSVSGGQSTFKKRNSKFSLRTFVKRSKGKTGESKDEVGRGNDKNAGESYHSGMVPEKCANANAQDESKGYVISPDVLVAGEPLILKFPRIVARRLSSSKLLDDGMGKDGGQSESTAGDGCARKSPRMATKRSSQPKKFKGESTREIDLDVIRSTATTDSVVRRAPRKKAPQLSEPANIAGNGVVIGSTAMTNNSAAADYIAGNGDSNNLTESHATSFDKSTAGDSIARRSPRKKVPQLSEPAKIANGGSNKLAESHTTSFDNSTAGASMAGRSPRKEAPQLSEPANMAGNGGSNRLAESHTTSFDNSTAGDSMARRSPRKKAPQLSEPEIIAGNGGSNKLAESHTTSFDNSTAGDSMARRSPRKKAPQLSEPENIAGNGGSNKLAESHTTSFDNSTAGDSMARRSPRKKAPQLSEPANIAGNGGSNNLTESLLHSDSTSFDNSTAGDTFVNTAPRKKNKNGGKRIKDFIISKFPRIKITPKSLCEEKLDSTRAKSKRCSYKGSNNVAICKSPRKSI